MLKEKVKLSFVIPVYNRQELLVECLKNLVKQKTSYKYEIIIIDDGSKPPVLKAVSKFTKSFKNMKIFTNRKNVGPAVSRNIGFKNSVGEYVCFLDSDDLVADDFVNQSIKCLERNNFPAVICKMKPLFIGKNTFKNIVLFTLRHYSRVLTFLYMNLFNNKTLSLDFFFMIRLSGMVFNRKYIFNTKFDRTYKSAEDWKYILDLYKKNSNFHIGLCNNTSIIYTHHPATETLGRSGYYKYYRKLIKEIPVNISNKIGIKIFKIYSNYEK